MFNNILEALSQTINVTKKPDELHETRGRSPKSARQESVLRGTSISLHVP